MKKIGIVSLGCPRNLVDSEVMLGSLKKDGFSIADDVGEGVDVFIVNTCSFVKSARQESIDTVLEAAKLKKEGKIRHLIVAGCLSQAYGSKLLKSLPEVDSIVGTSDMAKISDIVKNVLKNKKFSAVSGNTEYLYDDKSARLSLTAPHYAYVKISEGCDNACSYCIISRLRGRFRSRSMDSVIKEVEDISVSGKLKEIDIIGQDTTLFGYDLRGKSVFPELLNKIALLKNNVRWVRILYTHPAHYSDELILTVASEPKICKYLDIPIQHISNKILKKMNRRVTKEDISALIGKIRKSIPGVTLRTSVIVGFPGETEKDFKELLEFLKETRFERLGCFIYSREDGSPASRFKGHISEKLKNERFDEVMRCQQEISSGINKSFFGKTVDVLLDEKLEDGKYFGRTESDAPEVDGGVYVTGKDLKVGEFYNVKITDTMEYDLSGEAA
jgi:ribosomal protein S12 methylthiotransferase